VHSYSARERDREEGILGPERGVNFGAVHPSASHIRSHSSRLLPTAMTSQLDPPAFLTEALSDSVTESPGRIQVTLTFAQSLDGKIAGVGGKQLILSGKESMLMTHWYASLIAIGSLLDLHFKARMRTIHDAILVGIGTAVNDDPQLNSSLRIE
jgi:hypothetical protein